MLGALALMIAAPAAQATFHLMNEVREVYPGTGDDSYVELQMYAADRCSWAAIS